MATQTKTFTSSNGVNVRRYGLKTDRGYALMVDGARISPNDVQALREYFRDERDRELGRWRWPENPDYVVYPFGDTDDQVRILYEMTGYHSPVAREVAVASDSPTHGMPAARAYFATHPEKKPWHDAEHNDVWALQIKGGYEPELYRFAQDTACADSKVFRPVNNPARVFFEANSPLIESAEKVWPQGKES